jgi:hypothetical protein
MWHAAPPIEMPRYASAVDANQEPRVDRRHFGHGQRRANPIGGPLMELRCSVLLRSASACNAQRTRLRPSSWVFPEAPGPGWPGPLPAPVLGRRPAAAGRAGVPEATPFRTKSQLLQLMIARSWPGSHWLGHGRRGIRTQRSAALLPGATRDCLCPGRRLRPCPGHPGRTGRRAGREAAEARLAAAMPR